RAGIAALAERLAGLRIGIVGLGGTGSYILDLIAKTHVREIHLFDGDVFGQHNAFRAPGAAAIEELGARKVEHWTAVYSKIHRGVIPHPGFLDETNLGGLGGMDFVFLSMDPGQAKRAVVEQIRMQGTPFIDVGMGVAEEDGKLAGILRVTISTPERPADVAVGAGGLDDYSQNVQIAELNALNAALAVIRWKKHFGNYRDLGHDREFNYQTDTNNLINDDEA
ncbi:MAG: ThiF family adenylyltransferase, partial [Chloroflexota bacterium]